MSLSPQVHKCLYMSSLGDIQTFVAFAHCQHIDGGEKCVRAIPAGLNCLKNNGVLDQSALKFPNTGKF